MSLWHVRVVELLTASDTMSPGEHELSAPTVTCSPLTSAGFVDTAQNLGEGFVVEVCSRLLHDVQVHTAIARSTLPTRTIGASCPEMGRARQYFMAVGGMLVVFDREVGRTDTSSHSWHDVSGRCDNDNERHCVAVIPSSGSDGGLVVARTFRRRIDRADTASRVAADGCWGRAFRCS